MKRVTILNEMLGYLDLAQGISSAFRITIALEEVQ